MVKGNCGIRAFALKTCWSKLEYNKCDFCETNDFSGLRTRVTDKLETRLEWTEDQVSGLGLGLLKIYRLGQTRGGELVNGLDLTRIRLIRTRLRHWLECLCWLQLYWYRFKNVFRSQFHQETFAYSIGLTTVSIKHWEKCCYWVFAIHILLIFYFLYFEALIITDITVVWCSMMCFM